MISICTIRPVFKVTTMHTLRLASITHPNSLIARSYIHSTPKYASYALDLPSRCDRGTSEVPPLTSHVLLYKVLVCPLLLYDIVMTFMRFVGDSWTFSIDAVFQFNVALLFRHSFMCTCKGRTSQRLFSTDEELANSVGCVHWSRGEKRAALKTSQNEYNALRWWPAANLMLLLSRMTLLTQMITEGT
jgi:hypothetical protein